MPIIAIVAVSKNLAIGKGGSLPWHYPSDLKFFKSKTTGNAVVMGYTTWQSIGRPLPNRINLVLSRSRDVEGFSDVRVVRSRDDVLEFSKSADVDTYIIGGAETYKLFAGDIDEWIVTEVPVEISDADAFMPSNFLDGYTQISTQDLGDGLTVKTYKR